MRRRTLVALLLALVACVALPALAQADGDPGSDELLAQNLFTGDLSVSTAQQLQLGHLLDATASDGAPVRVAIIAKGRRPRHDHAALAEAADLCRITSAMSSPRPTTAAW